MTIKINKKREILQASFLFLSLTCLSSESFSMEPAEESKDGLDDDVSSRVIYRNGEPEIGPHACHDLTVRPSRKFSAVSPAERFMKGLVEGPHPHTKRLFDGVLRCAPYGENNPVLDLLKTLAPTNNPYDPVYFLKEARLLLTTTRGSETDRWSTALAACFEISALTPFLLPESGIPGDWARGIVERIWVLLGKSHGILKFMKKESITDDEDSLDFELINVYQKLFQEKGFSLFREKNRFSLRRLILSSNKYLRRSLDIINSKLSENASVDDIKRKLNGIASMPYHKMQDEIEEETVERNRRVTDFYREQGHKEKRKKIRTMLEFFRQKHLKDKKRLLREAIKVRNSDPIDTANRILKMEDEHDRYERQAEQIIHGLQQNVDQLLMQMEQLEVNRNFLWERLQQTHRGVRFSIDDVGGTS